VWLGGGPTRKLPLRGRPSSQTLPKGRGTWGKEVIAMKTYLANAFSLGMLPASPEGLTLRVRAIILEEVLDLLEEGFISAVGHTATAKVLNLLLGTEVPCNRISISLSKGDRLIVFQIKVRLEEGLILSEEEVLSLYEQGQISFYLVEVVG
jgi:hypothetical protein